jgi:hypothetical protein
MDGIQCGPSVSSHFPQEKRTMRLPYLLFGLLALMVSILMSISGSSTDVSRSSTNFINLYNVDPDILSAERPIESNMRIWLARNEQ